MSIRDLPLQIVDRFLDILICGRPHGKHFFCAERFGRLRSYVRPGGAAHMSAGPDEVRRPKSLSDLRASSSCLTTGCFWSSVATVSFIAFQCACQTSNCDLCNCSVDMLAGRAASLRLCEYFGAEDFAGPHYRPDDPGELVGQRHRDEACRLFRQSMALALAEPKTATIKSGGFDHYT